MAPIDAKRLGRDTTPLDLGRHCLLLQARELEGLQARARAFWRLAVQPTAIITMRVASAGRCGCS